MRLSLEYISSVVGGTLSPTANKNREIVGFFTDSRVPAQNQIYLALRGERVDGNSFVPELLSKGYAVITDNKENLSFRGDAICVPDVRNALQELARHYRETELSKVTIVGVTGSVGVVVGGVTGSVGVVSGGVTGSVNAFEGVVLVANDLGRGIHLYAAVVGCYYNGVLALGKVVEQLLYCRVAYP